MPLSLQRIQGICNVKKSNYKIFKVLKSLSKPKFSHFFGASVLIISLEDLILVFYIWVFNKTIEATMQKKIQFKQHFATTFSVLPNNACS